MLQKAREFFGQKFAAAGAIDYPIYALLACSVVLTSFLSWADSSNPERTLAIVGSNLLSVVALFLVILLVDKILRTQGSEISLSLGFLVLAGAGIGILKGALTWLGMELLGQGEPVDLGLWGRVVFSAIIGSIVVPSVSLFGSLRHRYAEQREALISEKIASARGDSYPETLVRFINEAKHRIQSPLLAQQRGALVTELRDIVNSDLRPLSQKIWTRESSRFPSFGLNKIARVAIFKHVYAIPWVVPLYALTTISPTIRVFSPEEAIWIQVVRSILLAIGLWLASRIPVRSFAAALFVYCASISLVAIAQVVLGIALSSTRELGEDIGFMIGNLIWLFQLTMFFGMGKAFIEMAKQADSEYEKFLSEPDLEEIRSYRELALKDRQLAQFLHGHLQAKLNGVASKIESRTMAVEIARDLDEVESVLNQALEEFGKQHATSIEEVVEALQTDWGGLANLSFEIAPLISESKELETIREVINEGIANAVRHGFATEVSITVADGSKIVIIDNGTGPRDGKAGLGSAYFSSASTSWSLQATPAGAKLTVNLS
jgi:signal transduction histidine kinase